MAEEELQIKPPGHRAGSGESCPLLRGTWEEGPLAIPKQASLSERLSRVARSEAGAGHHLPGFQGSDDT